MIKDRSNQLGVPQKPENDLQEDTSKASGLSERTKKEKKKSFSSLGTSRNGNRKSEQGGDSPFSDESVLCPKITRRKKAPFDQKRSGGNSRNLQSKEEIESRRLRRRGCGKKKWGSWPSAKAGFN